MVTFRVQFQRTSVNILRLRFDDGAVYEFLLDVVWGRAPVVHYPVHKNLFQLTATT